MMIVSDWIYRLHYLAFNRITYYDNQFPSNCGEINSDGSISFDCINMPKSIINEPDIVYKTKPAGYYVKPGQVIPDYDGLRIIEELCTDVRWFDFSTIVPGEFIYMRTDGHGGVYVGEFTLGLANIMPAVKTLKTYNVIECTAAWGGGVIPTYMDLKTGARYAYKGGPQIYAWEAHGKLSRYIDYSDIPDQVKITGRWDMNTTKLAQKVYGCKTINGKVVHQKKSYAKVCPACVPATEDKGSWYFTGTAGYSPLIAKIQNELGIKYKKGSASYGRMTIKTRKKLQKMLGTKVDGIIKTADVKAFQKHINKMAKKR